MEWLSSVSRSSGLEDGGDVLKKPKVQDEYRTFIESKLQRYWSQYPAISHLTRDRSDRSDSQRNLRSNILILFRKLREGLLASRRVDDFAYEVYETSLYLSVLFRAPAQTTLIVSQLIPHRHGVYDSSLTALVDSSSWTSFQRGIRLHRPPRHEQVPQLSSASNATSSLLQKRHESDLWSNTMSTVVIAFFHTLIHSYPLQSPCYSTLCCLQQSQSDRDEDARDEILNWLMSIATAVASRNYVRFQRLSRSEEVDRVCHRLRPLDFHGIESHLEMRRLALRCLVEDLRTKVRETVWEVLTIAYRELDTTGSSDWLLRSLMVNPKPRNGDDGDPQAPSVAQAAESWLEQRGEREARRKEGSESCWLLCRRRV